MPQRIIKRKKELEINAEIRINWPEIGNYFFNNYGELIKPSGNRCKSVIRNNRTYFNVTIKGKRKVLSSHALKKQFAIVLEEIKCTLFTEK